MVIRKEEEQAAQLLRCQSTFCQRRKVSLEEITDEIAPVLERIGVARSEEGTGKPAAEPEHSLVLLADLASDDPTTLSDRLARRLPRG
jgi:hypothetical protein